MQRRTLTYFALASMLFGLLCSSSSTLAQGKRRELGKKPPQERSRKTSEHASPPGSTTYRFTYFGFPNAQYTGAFSINSGAAGSKMEIVGAYGPDFNKDSYGSGMLLQVSGTKKTTTESFTTVNFPGFSVQQADGVNDSGEIVGQYTNSSNQVQGYLLSGGIFTKVQVPFTGAIQTLPIDINDSGLIVGVWEEASDGLEHGFQLSGATYTSFDDPAGSNTETGAVNNNGDIVGFYTDSAGVYHGFLLSGGTYTQIDYPGALGTFAYGINDSGDIVGGYCTNSECIAAPNVDTQGFLLSGGVFTTINVPLAEDTQLYNINNKGVIVGEYTDSSGTTLGFIATP